MARDQYPAYRPGWRQHEFLNDDTLFSYITDGRGPHFFSLIRTDGQVLYREEVPVSEQFSSGSYEQPCDARPSADGKRFALPFYKAHGGSALLDIPGYLLLKRLMVYDLPSHRWIYQLNGKRQKIRMLSGLALSPDGSLMGLVTQEGVLEVYRVP